MLPGGSSTLIDQVYSNILCHVSSGIVLSDITDNYQILFSMNSSIPVPKNSMRGMKLGSENLINNMSRIE